MSTDEIENISSRTNEDKHQFALAEYKESSTAYFKGVDVGLTTIKQYFTINVALLALVGARFTADSKLGIFPKYFEIPISLAGGIIFIVFNLSLKRYYSHLENCRKRCEEIESEYNGKLFSRLGEIAISQKDGIKTETSLHLVSYIFFIIWMAIILCSIILSR